MWVTDLRARLRNSLLRVREFLANYSRGTLLGLFVGAAIVSILFIIAIFAPFLSPYSPTEISFAPMLPPNEINLLGTDTLGRDVLSRAFWGGRASLTFSLLAMIIAMSAGIPMGAASGYIGGTLDRAAASAMDAFYAFPHYIMALLIAVMLGREPMNVALAVGIAYVPYFFRIVRSITLTLKERDFVYDTRSIGASSWYIIYHHILPYTVSSILVFFSMAVSRSIVVLAGLGFLGLGIQPPTPEWGTDMRWGRDIFLMGSWWVLVAPGIMIFLAVVGFSLLGEGLDSVFRERKGGRYAA